MEVKNLLGKLQTQEQGEPQQAQQPPKTPAPPVPRPAPRGPAIEDRTPQFQVTSGGRETMSNSLEEGIILDLGEGISLNIPIQKRMSLTDFIKLAEKVKALEMLSESTDVYRKGSL